MTTRLRGVVAAAATPLNADFSIDTARLIEHCRALLAEGCGGINLLGTSGEATSFSVVERSASVTLTPTVASVPQRVSPRSASVTLTPAVAS